MFENIKKKIQVTDDELVGSVLISIEESRNKAAKKAKRDALKAIATCKTAEYQGAFLKKRDGSREEFFVD